MLEITEFKSVNAGQNVLILGAIHGDEVCGSIASNKIISKIKSGEIEIKNGSVTFIPVSNPQAYKLKKRFCDVNLNRVIKKHKNPTLYEEKIANIIVDYIEKNDYILDIHSMYENGKPFSFQDYEACGEFSKAVGFDYIFLGWPDIYKDSKTIQDFSTESCANRFKKKGITIECGSHNSPDSIEIAEKSILKTLSFLDIIDYEYEKNKNQQFIKMEKVFFKEKEGVFVKNFAELEELKSGDIIAKYDDGEVVKAEKDCFITLPHKKAEIGQEWFYLGVKLDGCL